jgi:hypothetical protein
MVHFEDKFVAFIDILGFKNLVAAAEQGASIQLSDVLELLDKFQASKEQAEIAKYGPIACPQSSRIAPDLSFRATEVSDSLILSAEVSPAGVANLIGKAWGVTVRFLQEGVLCRGYMTRGALFHSGLRFLGSGYLRAYQHERRVAAFGQGEDERGTPFVELDPAVTEYVRTSTDDCVKKIYARCVESDGQYAALFPFRALEQSFVIGGIGARLVDYSRVRQGNVGLRGDIAAIKAQLWGAVDRTDARAVQKVEHYVRALDQQLRGCDHVDQVLDILGTPGSAQRE